MPFAGQPFQAPEDNELTRKIEQAKRQQEQPPDQETDEGEESPQEEADPSR